MKNDEHGIIVSSGEKYNWLTDFVYGGIDGAITTFAVVAGVEGASLSIPIILILGFANLFADGFSMATGKYLSDKASKEQFEKIKEIEFRHLKEKTEHETQEVKDILTKYNFKGKDLDRATEIIIAHPAGWVDLMMRNEFNMTNENINPLKGATATLISFITIGLIPLSAYLLKPLINTSNSETFLITCAATIVALFGVGAIKSLFSIKSWLASGIEIAIMGGLAASIAYGVGYILKTIVGA